MQLNMKKDSATSKPFHGAELICQAIHGNDPFGLLTFKREPGANAGSYKPPYFRYGTYTEHAKNFEAYSAQGIEPFILAGYSDGHGHADANILHTWVLCVDFDYGYPNFLVKNALIRPSFRIETSPGHFQAGWLLDTYCRSEDARPVLKAMADRLNGDFAYAKASQLIRLPGFENKKRGAIANLVGTPYLPKVYTLDFLKAAFDVELATNHIKKVVPLFDHSLKVARQTHDAAAVALDAEAALEYLANDADNYSSWVSTLMALVPLGDTGMALAEKFSKRSAKFDVHEFKQKWQQVQKSPGSVGTIFLRAQKLGWKNPGFRHSSAGITQIITSRDLGRMIAKELGDDYAVVVHEDNRKSMFLAWDGFTYKQISKTSRRQIVEQVGNKIIAALTENKSIDSNTTKTLKLLLGTNRSLEEVCEHVADAMVHDSERRMVSTYPYFGLANGVLNTISQELVPARYRPIPLVRSPIIFDSMATAPLFEKTVIEIFEGDEEMVRFIYQLFGYILMGKRSYQWFVVFLGPSSSNGKNTLADLLLYLLGEYATTLPITTIMTKSMVTDGATPALARLEGKRLAVVSEPNAKHMIDSGAVKSLTGDKVFSVRKIYEDTKDIRLDFLLMMLANTLPVVRDNDHGLWRRMQVIPFNRHFTQEEADENLPDKLIREASGILNIMLVGALDYLTNPNGIQVPEKVKAAISHQRNEVDPIETFISDAMHLEDGFQIQLKILYDQLYKDWAKQNVSFLPLTKKQFMARLETKGFKKFEKSRLTYFIGLRPNEMPVTG